MRRLVAALILALLMTSACEAAHPAIEQNAQTQLAMRTYYFKIAQSYTPKLFEAGVLSESEILEVWHSPDGHRARERIFLLLSDEGFQRVDAPHGQLREVSHGPLGVRNMGGWDPENPFPLPLDWAKNVQQFSSVRCSIALPLPDHETTFNEARHLLWRFARGHSVAELDELGVLKEIEAPTESIARFQLETTTHQTLADFDGTLVDLDLSHGGLVCRIERKLPVDEDPPTVRRFLTEVTRFARSPDGVWIPAEVKYLCDDQLFGTIEVRDFSINEPIAPKKLEVQFPEGARVTNLIDNTIHFWGTDKPARTFASFDESMEYLYARAREQQGQPARNPIPLTDQRQLSLSTVVIVNIVLLGLLAALFGARRYWVGRVPRR